MNKSKIIPKVFAVDFDGTCVGFEFPEIGKEIGAVPVLKDMVAAGHKIILYTMRSDMVDPASPGTTIIIPKAGEEYNFLSQAVAWFNKHDIPLYGINHNPTQSSWTDSPKVYADYYIDDIALGCQGPGLAREELEPGPEADLSRSSRPEIFLAPQVQRAQRAHHLCPRPGSPARRLGGGPGGLGGEKGHRAH